MKMQFSMTGKSKNTKDPTISKAVKTKPNIGPIKRIDRKMAGKFSSLPLFEAQKLD